MKLAILSRKSSLYSTRRLIEAARSRGHQVRVLDPLRCYMRIASEGFDLHYKGTALGRVDAVIPRIGASVTRYGAAVLRQLELMGAYSVNASDAILRARDKLHAQQLLAAAGVMLPASVFGDSPDDTADLLSMLGAAPHVIKLTEGSQGAGVMLAEKHAASQGMVEALRGLHAQFLVQEFIAEAGGRDLRCLVVGDVVVAAIERRAAEGEFRANLHRGGSAYMAEPTPEEMTTAVQATKLLGLEVAGVDMLRSARGSLLLEVNASPGLEGVETTTGIDVASHIVAHIEQQLQHRKGRVLAD